MIKKKKLRVFILFTLLFSNSLLVQAQESYIRDRWNVKLTGFPELRHSRTSALFARAEVNYGFGDYLEAGLSMGFQRYYVFSQYAIDDGITKYNKEPAMAPTYALNANLHLLPLFVKEENFRFDLYAAGKIGGHYVGRESSFLYMPDDYKFYKTQWNFFIGAGAAFYFSKRFGVYAEYGFHKDLRYKSGDRKKLNLGLSLKF